MVGDALCLGYLFQDFCSDFATFIPLGMIGGSCDLGGNRSKFVVFVGYFANIAGSSWGTSGLTYGSR